MKWRPFQSGVPYTCQDCPAYAELLSEVAKWRDIAYEYYLTDTDCSCHICDRYREAAGIDHETV